MKFSGESSSGGGVGGNAAAVGEAVAAVVRQGTSAFQLMDWIGAILHTLDDAGALGAPVARVPGPAIVRSLDTALREVDVVLWERLHSYKAGPEAWIGAAASTLCLSGPGTSRRSVAWVLSSVLALGWVGLLAVMLGRCLCLREELLKATSTRACMRLAGGLEGPGLDSDAATAALARAGVSVAWLGSVIVTAIGDGESEQRQARVDAALMGRARATQLVEAYGSEVRGAASADVDRPDSDKLVEWQSSDSDDGASSLPPPQEEPPSDAHDADVRAIAPSTAEVRGGDGVNRTNPAAAAAGSMNHLAQQTSPAPSGGQPSVLHIQSQQGHVEEGSAAFLFHAGDGSHERVLPDAVLHALRVAEHEQSRSLFQEEAVDESPEGEESDDDDDSTATLSSASSGEPVASRFAPQTPPLSPSRSPSPHEDARLTYMEPLPRSRADSVLPLPLMRRNNLSPLPVPAEEGLPAVESGERQVEAAKQRLPSSGEDTSQAESRALSSQVSETLAFLMGGGGLLSAAEGGHSAWEDDALDAIASRLRPTPKPEAAPSPPPPPASPSSDSSAGADEDLELEQQGHEGGASDADSDGCSPPQWSPASGSPHRAFVGHTESSARDAEESVFHEGDFAALHARSQRRAAVRDGRIGAGDAPDEASFFVQAEGDSPHSTGPTALLPADVEHLDSDVGAAAPEASLRESLLGLVAQLQQGGRPGVTASPPRVRGTLFGASQPTAGLSASEHAGAPVSSPGEAQDSVAIRALPQRAPAPSFPDSDSDSSAGSDLEREPSQPPPPSSPPPEDVGECVRTKLPSEGSTVLGAQGAASFETPSMPARLAPSPASPSDQFWRDSVRSQEHREAQAAARTAHGALVLVAAQLAAIKAEAEGPASDPSVHMTEAYASIVTSAAAFEAGQERNLRILAHELGMPVEQLHEVVKAAGEAPLPESEPPAPPQQAVGYSPVDQPTEPPPVRHPVRRGAPAQLAQRPGHTPTHSRQGRAGAVPRPALAQDGLSRQRRPPALDAAPFQSEEDSETPRSNLPRPVRSSPRQSQPAKHGAGAFSALGLSARFPRKDSSRLTTPKQAAASGLAGEGEPQSLRQRRMAAARAKSAPKARSSRRPPQRRPRPTPELAAATPQRAAFSRLASSQTLSSLARQQAMAQEAEARVQAHEAKGGPVRRAASVSRASLERLHQGKPRTRTASRTAPPAPAHSPPAPSPSTTPVRQPPTENSEQQEGPSGWVSEAGTTPAVSLRPDGTVETGAGHDSSDYDDDGLQSAVDASVEMARAPRMPSPESTSRPSTPASTGGQDGSMEPAAAQAAMHRRAYLAASGGSLGPASTQPAETRSTTPPLRPAQHAGAEGARAAPPPPALSDSPWHGPSRRQAATETEASLVASSYRTDSRGSLLPRVSAELQHLRAEHAMECGSDPPPPPSASIRELAERMRRTLGIEPVTVKPNQGAPSEQRQHTDHLVAVAQAISKAAGKQGAAAMEAAVSEKIAAVRFQPAASSETHTRDSSDVPHTTEVEAGAGEPAQAEQQPGEHSPAPAPAPAPAAPAPAPGLSMTSITAMLADIRRHAAEEHESFRTSVRDLHSRADEFEHDSRAQAAPAPETAQDEASVSSEASPPFQDSAESEVEQDAPEKDLRGPFSAPGLVWPPSFASTPHAYSQRVGSRTAHLLYHRSTGFLYNTKQGLYISPDGFAGQPRTRFQVSPSTGQFVPAPPRQAAAAPSKASPTNPALPAQPAESNAVETPVSAEATGRGMSRAEGEAFLRSLCGGQRKASSPPHTVNQVKADDSDASIDIGLAWLAARKRQRQKQRATGPGSAQAHASSTASTAASPWSVSDRIVEQADAVMRGQSSALPERSPAAVAGLSAQESHEAGAPVQSLHAANRAAPKPPQRLQEDVPPPPPASPPPPLHEVEEGQSSSSTPANTAAAALLAHVSPAPLPGRRRVRR